MTSISAPAASAFLSLLLIASALPAQGSDTASSTVGVSKVRIVRLSEVKGEVQFDVNGGRGFEMAMANLPIVEQSRLQTGTGVAEVEFEDNSTLRLAPNTLVEFPRLELLASGAKASTVHVLKGMVYVSMVNTPGNDFTVLFGGQKLQLPPSSHIRLQMEPNQAKLAVLEGAAIHIDAPSGAIEVPKKKTVTFALAGQSQPAVAKNVSSETYDSWDRDNASYHKQFAASNARPALLRRLQRRRRMRKHVASLFRQRGLGSVFERRVGVLPGRGLFLGVSIPLGMGPLPLRQLDQLQRLRLGMAAGQFLVWDQQYCGWHQRRLPAPAGAGASAWRILAGDGEPQAAYRLHSRPGRLIRLSQGLRGPGRSPRRPGQPGQAFAARGRARHGQHAHLCGGAGVECEPRARRNRRAGTRFHSSRLRAGSGVAECGILRVLRFARAGD
jgi:hypothetical protein